MEVILLTVFLSLMLVIFFIGLFLHQKKTRGFGGLESDALMPLDDDENYHPEKRNEKDQDKQDGVSGSRMASGQVTSHSGPSGFSI